MTLIERLEGAREGSLPNYNRLVLAKLEGSRVDGIGVRWRREGWDFMRRLKDSPTTTVHDEWCQDLYDAALSAIDADFAYVTKWAYVEDIEAIAKLTGRDAA